MDLKLSDCLKNKVIQIAPAIFADNMMLLIMGKYDIPWNMTFTNEDIHQEFFHTSGVDIGLYIEDIVQPWHDTHIPRPVMWHVNEEALRKLLYFFRIDFLRKSDDDAKSSFLYHCAFMIYLALDYYKKGVKSALTIVFDEIYLLACLYSERMAFKCDLIYTSTEV